MGDQKNFIISGKICAVTGGASGIGFCFADRLLEHGAQRVYILDFNPQTGVESEQNLQEKYDDVSRVKFIQTDVATREKLEGVFDQIIVESKRLDLLMNNAGTPIAARAIAVNLMGVYNCLECAFKHMSKANGGNGGVIINTASNLGFVGCVESPLYSASKHGVIGLTRSYGHRRYYSKSGIKVMAICPSSTETPLLDIVEGDDYKGKMLSSIQSPENVANCMLLALNEGDRGAIFVSELGENYEIVFPRYNELRKKPTIH